MSTNINISPVISTDIGNTINKAFPIKSFGNQNKTKENIIVGNQDKNAELNSQLDELTQKEVEAGLTKSDSIQKAQTDFYTRQITEEQYYDKLATINAIYQAEIETLSIQRQKIIQDKENISNNPNNIIKKDQDNFKKNIISSKKKIQESENRSKRDLTKQVISNIAKNAVPIIALQLSNQFITLLSQRKKLEVLVDQVNNYIDTKVKDQQTATIATNLRNNAIALINSNIKKLDKIKKIIDTISKIITVVSVIIAIITKILNLPLLLPLKISVQPKLQKALELLSEMNVILVMASIILANEITRLNELIDRLKQISLKLEQKTLVGSMLNEQEFADLIKEFSSIGTENNFPPYKDFTFKVKEEQNPAFVVKGNKRHYAVAINRDGTEVIKSEYSFTLDPNDLIDQLKLIIDQQNLQG